MRSLLSYDYETIMNLDRVPTGTKRLLTRELNLSPQRSHPTTASFELDRSAEMSWFRNRPDPLNESDDFFDWIDNLVWQLRRVDPTGCSWVGKINDLLTGIAREKSDQIVSITPLIQGREFLREIKNAMRTELLINRTRIELSKLKWDMNEDPSTHYRRVRKLMRLVEPNIDDDLVISECLRTLPDKIKLKIMAHGDYDNEDRFLSLFCNKAEELRLDEANEKEERKSQNWPRF